MVERQLRGRGIRDEAVLAVMASLPRDLFVPPDLRSQAYSDDALPIASGQSISQPYMVARMTDKYKLTSGKTKDNTREGTVYGLRIMIVNGKHNNKHFRKVLTGDGKNTIFAI